jgi:hypothetical protein
MRVRVPIAPWLVVTVCAAVAAFGWYQGRPRHVVVRAALGSGIHSSADPGAQLIWYDAALESASGEFWVDVFAQVRDVPGATVRCTLEGYPGAGGTTVLTGASPPSTTASWSFIKIDRTTSIRSVLCLGPAPTYTLDYSTPPSRPWAVTSVLAIVAGPVVGVGSWAAAKPRRTVADRRAGFDVLPPQARDPDLY